MEVSQMKQIAKRAFLVVKKVLSSKVLFAVCIGAVWLTFGDENSIIDYMQYSVKVRQLTNEVNYYKKQIADCNRKMEEMKTDKESLEKYAREQYYMKRQNEDIFVVK